MDAPTTYQDPHNIPHDECVAPQPRRNYVPPAFYKKTASPEEYAELSSWLEELWFLHEVFAGERSREVEAYLHWTGQTGTLNRRIMAWCRSYCDRRLARVDPKDHNNKFNQFHRIFVEFHEISRKFDGPNSLDYIFANLFRTYADWLVYSGTIRHYLTFEYRGYGEIGIHVSRKRYCRHCMDIVFKENYHRDLVWEFLRFLEGKDILVIDGKDVPPGKGATGRPEEAEDWEAIPAELGRLASDFVEMRPFFLNEHGSEPVLEEFAPNAWLAWRWSYSCRIGNLYGGSTEEAASSAAKMNQAWVIMGVDDEGRIADHDRSWLRLDGPALVQNLAVLRRFHDTVFETYSRLDFAGLRNQGPAPAEEPAEVSCAEGSSAEAPHAEEIFSLSCRDLAERIVPEAEVGRPENRRRIGLLRINELLSYLTNSFGCEARQGKGSEINLYRPGAPKLFTLGCHGKNPEVSSIVVRRLVRRLGIPEGDWLKAVYG